MKLERLKTVLERNSALEFSRFQLALTKYEEKQFRSLTVRIPTETVHLCCLQK